MHLESLEKFRYQKDRERNREPRRREAREKKKKKKEEEKNSNKKEAKIGRWLLKKRPQKEIRKVLQ